MIIYRSSDINLNDELIIKKMNSSHSVELEEKIDTSVVTAL